MSEVALLEPSRLACRSRNVTLTSLVEDHAHAVLNGSVLALDFVLKTAFFFLLAPWLIFSGFALSAAAPGPAEQVQRQAAFPEAENLKVVITNELTFLQR